MKTAKRILSWLLLACMLLTLASCKRDEEKAADKSTGSKPAVCHPASPVQGRNDAG